MKMNKILKRFKSILPIQKESLPEQGLDNDSSFTGTDCDDASKPHYRGFASSISHQFISKSSQRTDACALVCCGILQADRDRYLITGIPPPTCARRLILHASYHIFLPVFLFIAACFAAVNIVDPYTNQLVSTVLVALMCVFLMMQCCKGRWKRSGLRQELLWRTFECRHGKTAQLLTNDADETKYMQGQSSWDVACAHAFLGCYWHDQPIHRQPDVEPRDLMGCLWRFYTQLCCGKLCGCYLQICGMCAIAQEARELELTMQSHRRSIDYVTMQRWSDYYPTILKKRVAQELCGTLSQLSIHLLQAWVLFFAILGGLTWYFEFSYGHVLVCLGTFLHAFFVMGIVHWVWHRHTVSLDLIIKAFSCGFFLSTTLAMCWETVIGLILRVIMDLMLALAGIKVTVDTDGYTQLSSFRLPGGFATASAASRMDYVEAFGQRHPILYGIYLAIAAFCLAALVEELVKYLGYQMVTDHPDFWDRSELEKAIEAAEENVEKRRDESKDSSSSLKDLPTLHQDRPRNIQGAMITITMIAVALGFACCENLLYIFLYNEHSVAMETSILIARMIFPVHPICAAIQSIGIVQRDVEKSPHSELGQALLPAIIVHGTFDFVLMLFDFINSYNGRSGGWTPIILAFAIIVAAIRYYVEESKEQRDRLMSEHHQTMVDQSSLL